MQSLTARIALAKQSAKGSAASTGFHIFKANQSATNPRFDYQENQNYHIGVHQRASTQQARAIRTSVINTFGMSFAVWPAALPRVWQGVGFGVSSANNTTYYTHTITKADVDAALYLTSLHAIGEDTDRFERRLTDLRLTSLEFAASPGALSGTVSGFGITEAASAGNESIVTAETAGPLIPGTGSLAWGALNLGSPRQHTVTIERPVDEQDQKVHAFGRADLPETGFAVRGTMTGLDMSYGTYKKLAWGGTSGTGPDDAIVTDSLTFSYESAAVISGAAVPYSMQIAVTLAEIRITDFEARDNNIVRCNLQWTMIDESASAPVTVTIKNFTASY
jgi:hypothetical protein